MATVTYYNNSQLGDKISVLTHSERRPPNIYSSEEKPLYSIINLAT